MADARITICRRCGLPHPESNPFCFCGSDYTVEEWAQRTVDAMFRAADEVARRASEGEAE